MELATTNYSSNVEQSFPLNAWYAAAWDHEIRHELLPRTICNLGLVLYRTTDGQAVALEDACWHRLVPLSMGKLIGNDVICGYHGLVYNSAGRCIQMPSQETINPSACVRSFPVVEAHRFVWVWPGDPALADPSLVPDLHWNNDPGWAGDGKLFEMKCDYRLVVDNLMDLTHESFLHAESLGNKELVDAPFEATHGDHSATVSRWMIDIEPPPFWRRQSGLTDHVDRWQIIHFQPPCTVALDVGVAPTGTGAPEGDRSRGSSMWVINTITPSTNSTCLYFWANVRDYHKESQSWTSEIREGISKVFHQDLVMLEAQQKAIEDHEDHRFYNLNIDAGSLWARHLIDEMISKERTAELRIAGNQ